MGKMFSRKENVDTTGLTDREKKAILGVWRTFCKEHEDFGVLLFQAFFVKFPEHLSLFKSFNEKPLRALITDDKFRAHCTMVGNEIASIIETLENVPELIERLDRNAMLHQRIRGVMPTHFADFCQVFVEVLIANHEDLMTPSTELAWKKFFEFLLYITNASYEQAKQARKSSADSYKVATMSMAYVALRGTAADTEAASERGNIDAAAMTVPELTAERKGPIPEGGMASNNQSSNSSTRKTGEDTSQRVRKPTAGRGIPPASSDHRASVTNPVPGPGDDAPEKGAPPSDVASVSMKSRTSTGSRRSRGPVDAEASSAVPGSSEPPLVPDSASAGAKAPSQQAAKRRGSGSSKSASEGSGGKPSHGGGPAASSRLKSKTRSAKKSRADGLGDKSAADPASKPDKASLSSDASTKNDAAEQQKVQQSTTAPVGQRRRLIRTKEEEEAPK